LALVDLAQFTMALQLHQVVILYLALSHLTAAAMAGVVLRLLGLMAVLVVVDLVVIVQVDQEILQQHLHRKGTMVVTAAELGLQMAAVAAVAAEQVVLEAMVLALKLLALEATGAMVLPRQLQVPLQHIAVAAVVVDKDLELPV
jgi:hypothetical protein